VSSLQHETHALRRTHRLSRGALLVALAGCNQIFGLDETVPSQDRGMVTGVYKLRWAENDLAGAATVRDGVHAPGELTAEVELDDGTRRDVTIRGDGTFSFPTATPGQAYSLSVRSGYGHNTFQLDATDLVLVDRIAARRDRQLVPPNTELVYEVADRPLPTLTGREEIMTTGIWTRAQVTNDIPIRYSWGSAVAQSQPLGLLDGARNDDAYYVFIDRATTYNRIMSAARARATLVGGQSTTVMGTAMNVAPTLCTRIDVGSRQERDRLYGLFSNASSALALWTIHATPSAELGFTATLPLAFSLSSDDAADVTASIDYGNPFPGGARILDLALVVTRSEGDFSAVTVHVPVAADCATTTTIAPGVVAVPTAIEIAGSVLGKKDQFVTIDRGAPVPMTWQVSADGTHQDAVVKLFELVDTVGVLKQTIYTAGTQALLDPRNLEMGRKYFVHVQLRSGIPGAANGHYDVVEDAQANGDMLSVTFTVAN
jgi:hypothetical protein